MARFELMDFEWSVIQLLLPTNVRGGPRRMVWHQVRFHRRNIRKGRPGLGL